MHLSTIDTSPCNRRGDGQRSYLLLSRGQFGSEKLAVTWVDCAPGSRQSVHAHPVQEQAYVIVRGRGEMMVGAEVQEVSEGSLVFVPPATGHAIFNHTDESLVYISSTVPPFAARVSAGEWQPEEFHLR
jgi:mannose-6-phosphate isomerase-like protein (cupin superfamily)